MIKKLSLCAFMVAMVTCMLLPTAVQADWFPDDGHKMHFPQMPDPQGWDVCLEPIMLADDFMCSESGPITDIHFWISWKDDLIGEVPFWYIGIWSNLETDLGSQPGQELWRWNNEGELKIRPEEPSVQGWYCPQNENGEPIIIPENHERYFQINITHINNPFKQERGQVYWLVIRAYTDSAEPGTARPHVGWKTSVEQWKSPALWMNSANRWKPLQIDPTGEIPMDLSFVITGRDYPTEDWDFGDAPDLFYRTLLSSNGARHLINPDVFLGNLIDPEPDGQPTNFADGDDINLSDDEDGVTFLTQLIPGMEAKIEVVASIDGFLDAWVDYNSDNDWNESDEQIFAGQPVVAGVNTLSFMVPTTAMSGPNRATFARFRFSMNGYLNYFGPAEDGEVEDYPVFIQEVEPRLDFGDLPDSYQTVLANDGARHIINPKVFLGGDIDGEVDGQPTASANGDDTGGIDDEDGVLFTSPIIAGELAKIEVKASVDGLLFGWVDFNNDGTFDASEQIFSATPLLGGVVNYLSFNVPNNAVPGASYARFRFTNAQSSLPWYGLAENGEVEDYLIRILAPIDRLDFGDAPDRPYPTLLSSNGARHIINPDIFLGMKIDGEPDGQPTVAAMGDDLADTDDEDGVVFLTSLVPANMAKVEVTASIKGVLDAWIDFNTDGDWNDPGEQIFAGEIVTGGINYLAFNVPASANVNVRTYARFRFNTYTALPYDGIARNGEVEDYIVSIEEPERLADLGDAPDSTNSYPGVAMTAYPDGTQAIFPTVYGNNLPFPGPIHRFPEAVALLGLRVSGEQEADMGFDQDPTNNIVPKKDAADLDKHDDSIKLPLRLPGCMLTRFEYRVRVINPIDQLYVNVWFDWNRDGDWDDTLICPTSMAQSPEWAVQNQVLAGLPAGLHTITTPGFIPWHPMNTDERPEEIWMRITLSERPWTPPLIAIIGGGGSGPANGYYYGETEDYLFIPDTTCRKCADLNCDHWVNLEDLAILASQWLSSCSGGTMP